MVPYIGREMKQKRKPSTKDSRHSGSGGLMPADLSYFVSLVNFICMYYLKVQATLAISTLF